MELSEVVYILSVTLNRSIGELLQGEVIDELLS